jgi:Rps23 Pro-64 3,4-dihydroxylase Tpa1-like proline 4-hydroxylase
VAKLPLPPHRQFTGVLAPAELQALLDWTLANRESFSRSEVIGARYDPDVRLSERVRKLGPMRPPLEARLGALWPQIAAAAGARPFEPYFLELEIAAHGEGGFFKRHSDIPFGPERRRTGGDGTGRHERIVSTVLYFHHEPKGFSGGALRLYRFGGGDGPDDHVDVEPVRNSLLVFPSWALHEVRPVSCPSGRFEDHRFAVNAWFCREAADAA